MSSLAKALGRRNRTGRPVIATWSSEVKRPCPSPWRMREVALRALKPKARMGSVVQLPKVPQPKARHREVTPEPAELPEDRDAYPLLSELGLRVCAKLSTRACAPEAAEASLRLQ
eukprot:15457985-Alexandrium_andersonii.AAC.1